MTYLAPREGIEHHHQLGKVHLMMKERESGMSVVPQDVKDKAWILSQTAGFIDSENGREQLEKAILRERDRLNARMEELEKALEPFAQVANFEERAERFSSVMVNIDHCRAARQALKGEHA